MLNYLLYKLWSHNHNVSSSESLNMFWYIWLVCYSETEKKTTLDQALRGVLGDQIVSKLAAIYFKWSYRIELTCPVLWKPEIVAFLSAGWAEGELWWLPVSHLPEHRCSNRRFVTVWKKGQQWKKEYLMLCHIIQIVYLTWDYISASNSRHYQYCPDYLSLTAVDLLVPKKHTRE